MSDGNRGEAPAARAPIRIVLADDHPFVLLGLELVFDAEGMEIVKVCEDGESTLVAVRAYRPDILMLDLAMPRMSGYDVLREIRSAALPTRVIVLTASGDVESAEKAKALGAHGVMGKSEAPARILQCVRDVHGGRQVLAAPADPRPAPVPLSAPQLLVEKLTRRELQIVDLIALALPNKAIASRMQITEGTVKVHLHRIYEKLGVRGRMDLLLHSVRKAG
jgi:two-component system nitrate/nitrite response regulator NarL